MKKTYVLEDLCCANCAAAIERGVAKIDGVESASVSFLTSKLVVEAEEDGYEEIFKKIQKVVKKTEPDVAIKEI
ncbi:MAG: cation transporter [Firmicutes bacterium]|nr:cation transporter [Bacillota bacterium]